MPFDFRTISASLEAARSVQRMLDDARVGLGVSRSPLNGIFLWPLSGTPAQASSSYSIGRGLGTVRRVGVSGRDRGYSPSALITRSRSSEKKLSSHLW